MDTNRFDLIPDDSRIFHREGASVEIIRQVIGVERINSYTVRFKLNSQNCNDYYLNVIAYEDEIFRIQFAKEKDIVNKTMIELSKAQDEGMKLSLVEDEDMYILTAFGYTLKVKKDLFNLCLFNKENKLIWDLENTDKKSWCVTPAMGYRVNEDNSEEYPFISMRIKNEEHLYGLGEKFNAIEKKGTRATIWAADTMGTNTTDLSYKSIPVLMSTSGWGVMMYSSYRSFWEIGSFSYTTTSVLVEDSLLDFFLFGGENIKELTKKYCNLVAKPMLPPKWALGTWMSKCSYNTNEEIESVVSKLKEKRIPVDIINIDTAWLKEVFYHTIGVDSCDFNWDSEKLPNRKELFKWLKDRGYDICTWINSYIPEHVELYKEASSKGYLVKDINGDNARIESGNPTGIVDFTNEEAITWWQGLLAEFINDGVSCVKPDYADRIPVNGVFSNGKLGRELHNLYPHLYVKAVDEITKELTGNNIMFRRSGYIGSNKYPVTWAGDTQTSWVAMQCVLRSGLSAGIVGDSFWSHDIGGFTGPKPSDEMYVRWSQFGMLSSIARFHGTTPREPWEYSKEAEQIVTKYMRFRYRLMPYLWSLTKEATETGLPLMRHLIMECPNDPAVYNIEDQYMLGENLLVAPVVTPDTKSRFIYFPEGNWVAFELENTEIIQGGKYHKVEAPLERIPLFLKDGAVIPMYAIDVENTKEDVKDYELVAFTTGKDIKFELDEDGNKIELNIEIVDGVAKVKLNHNVDNVTVKLLGIKCNIEYI